MVITIDGPAGAGKSTVAKRLAERLGYCYLDTGAMYRALTLKAMRQNLDLSDEEGLVELAKKTLIDFKRDAEGQLLVMLDDEKVSCDIRTVEVTEKTFYIAQAPNVREQMVIRQREIAQNADVVVEGRDTGTVVFPNAECKFYLDADLNERAQRRIKEWKAKDPNLNETRVQSDLESRDQKDLTRSVGPLKVAEDAVVIDSTSLSIDEVVNALYKHVLTRKEN